ncbi:MAG: deoxyribodipyrimidine photo-lyase [Anaerolineae bacterium]|nr:deoxyribodipyrimidine photo-lyase [Anaerolineae bacterium]
MRRLLWWIRRDLRLTDNTALAAALMDADQVIPVFVLDDRLLRSPRVQGPRIAWMLDGLRQLDSDLRKHGVSLVIRRGDSARELVALCREAQAEGVCFNRDYSPYAARRDTQVSEALNSAGYVARSFKDLVIHEADEVVSKQGKPYGVYTPFRKAWTILPKSTPMNMPQLERLAVLDNLTRLPIPTAQALGCTQVPHPIVEPGEQAAIRQLESFMDEAIYHYDDQRNTLGIDGSAIISPYLRWGMISPRACYWAAQQALQQTNHKSERQSVSLWIGELIWREFFYQVLAINPHSVRQNFKAQYDRLAWDNNPDHLQAWMEGQTGYPIVDAAVRQMTQTGWMHNRARLIVASFLCKDLLIDWRQGEAVFMRGLLDGDVANNVGNWQWSAGTGTDAAPYFRVFNPTTQGQKFDPDGVYIRRYVPELAAVPNESIHEPAQLTRVQQERYGCVIGRDYPAPIVNHEEQRDRALAMYRAARSER